MKQSVELKCQFFSVPIKCAYYNQYLFINYEFNISMRNEYISRRFIAQAKNWRSTDPIFGTTVYTLVSVVPQKRCSPGAQ